jgi:SET domain-containing protein
MTFKIKRSSIDGKGLFAAKTIPARRKIGEFIGELITTREARRRAGTKERISIVEIDEKLAIDGSGPENVFRYLNHSCNPNAYIRIFRQHIEVYSLRKIAAGEEVTCDYGETHHDGKLKCRCGNPKCREFM